MAAATTKFPFQFNPSESITYLGSDPEYWPDSGPVAVPELQTPRVSGYQLDALELASHGKVVLTTSSDKKALEVSALGLTDPALVDTTVLDAGAHSLHVRSDASARVSATDIEQLASRSHRERIDVPDPSDPTFNKVATESRMVLGSGVLDAVDGITSGGFVETTPDTFMVRHDGASIRSEAGAESTIRYDAELSHEFFAGGNARTQALGTGAVEIRSDKVIIRKDVDLVGTINASATNLDLLNVEDQILELAHTSDPDSANRDTLLAGGKAGLTIGTVPGSYTNDAAYMGKFLDQSGAKLFVNDATQAINVEKAKTSGIFTKELAFYINQGAKTSGQRTDASRLTEPYWNVSGGAFHLKHHVPNGQGGAKRFTLGFRITDDGSMEIVRLTHFLLWDSANNTYVQDGGKSPTAKLMSRYVAP